MNLKPIADDLWFAEYDLKLPGGAYFRCRMTVIRLADGKLFLYSPIPRTDELDRAVAGLGRVAHLVAPNKFHHLFLKTWAKAYPEAATYGAPGLAEKKPNFRFDAALTDEAPEAWRGQLEQKVIAGAPMVNEVAFFHPPSKSLLVCDLVFNIADTRGWLTPWMLRAMGAHRRFAQSRAWRFFTKDRGRAQASLEKIFAWDFQRVIMAHGTILEEGAKAHLRQAVRRMLRGRDPLPATGQKHEK